MQAFRTHGYAQLSYIFLIKDKLSTCSPLQSFILSVIFIPDQDQMSNKNWRQSCCSFTS